MSRPPKSGSGLTVHGLDFDSAPDVTVYDNGTVLTPRLRLVGTNDLWTLTLTEPATLATDDRALSESTVGVIVAAAGPEEVDFLKERYGPLLMVASWLRLLDD
jgi:hypothetical protein